MTRLDYASPRSRANRLAGFFLLFVQINAVTVFAISGLGFWMAIAGIGIEIARTGTFDDDYFYHLTNTAPPLMLSSVAWTACQILRRMSN